MPNKPVKYGIKAFTLADGNHGYLLDALIYTGGDTLQEASSQYEDLPQPARVVLHLMEPYLDKGYHVYTDRYYTSIPLVQALLDRSTAFTGTAIRNRAALPDAIRTPSRLGDNEVWAFCASRPLALEWRAPKKKKSLVMVTSECSACMTTVQLRRNQEEMEKPLVVGHYNHSMNGVDRADQHTVYYSFIRKSRKWWRKLFFLMIEVGGYILYRLHTQRPATHLVKRCQIVETLATHHLQSCLPHSHPGRPHKRP